MGIKHFKTAEFDAAVAAAPLAMVDFWADWCGPCKMLSPVIESLADQYEGKVLVGKVNVDEEPDLARRFGVMSIPAGVGNLPSGAPPLSFCGQQGQPRRRAARSPFAGAVIRASAWCRPITTGHRDWGCKGNAQLPEAGFRKPSVFDSPFHKKGKFSWKTRPGITGCATSPRAHSQTGLF